MTRSVPIESAGPSGSESGEGLSPGRAFQAELLETLTQLQRSLADVIARVEADPAKPQVLARRFSLNKNLTWKVSRIITSDDVVTVVPHIPGTAGLRIFAAAMDKSGAPAASVAAVLAAGEAFDDMVVRHAGNRSTLETMVAGSADDLDEDARNERLIASRKKAYEGNSETLGVRGRVQLAISILAPNADRPDWIDLAQVGGLVDFRRLRSDARWLMFRRERWSDDEDDAGRDVTESLDPDHPVESGVPMMGDFCSHPIPNLDLIVGASEEQYELPPGPIGDTAAMTCVHGQVSRAVVPAFADNTGEYGEVGSSMITPVECVVLELYAHRAFSWITRPELVMYSRMDGQRMDNASRRDRNMLTVYERVEDLGTGLEDVPFPPLPSIGDMADATMKRLAWNPEDFRRFRVAIPYPPIPASLLLRTPLPTRS